MPNPTTSYFLLWPGFHCSCIRFSFCATFFPGFEYYLGHLFFPVRLLGLHLHTLWSSISQGKARVVTLGNFCVVWLFFAFISTAYSLLLGYCCRSLENDRIIGEGEGVMASMRSVWRCIFPLFPAPKE